MLLALVHMATFASQPRPAAQTAQTCIPQPLPRAMDSVGEPTAFSHLIEFAATPSLQHPGRAWVVRLSRKGRVEAKIEILRLRQQENCNRYNIENSWQAPLRDAEYAAIAATVVPAGVPGPAIFVPSTPEQWPDLTLDGTGIELRLRSYGWGVTHSSNHYGKGGAISAIFHDLVSKYVPASELPADDWRTAP